MICAVVLAAGEGRRLRPLTEVVPKALCPVGNVPLLDRALAALADLGLSGPDSVAVNASWLAEQVVAAVDGRAHVSVEPGRPLGTAGGLGRLRDWVGGRDVLVGNADAYLPDVSLDAMVGNWDGKTVRLLGVPTSPDDPYRFGRHAFAGWSLVPWCYVATLEAAATLAAEPAELVHQVWRPAERAGRLSVVEHPGVFMDTGTPPRYLAANLHAAGGGSLVAPGAVVSAPLDHAVVGAGAVVRGPVTRSVVWPGGYVVEGEHLVDAVRVGRDLTVRAVG